MSAVARVGNKQIVEKFAHTPITSLFEIETEMVKIVMKKDTFTRYSSCQ